MALAGVDALYEFELYDTAETGVLELCEKPPSDVNNGLSLWRRRDPSRVSLMVTISSCPLVDVYSVPRSTSAGAGCVLVPGRCWLMSYVGNPAREQKHSPGTEANQALEEICGQVEVAKMVDVVKDPDAPRAPAHSAERVD